MSWLENRGNKISPPSAAELPLQTGLSVPGAVRDGQIIEAGECHPEPNTANAAALERCSPRAFRLLSGAEHRSAGDHGLRLPDASDADAIAKRIHHSTASADADSAPLHRYSQEAARDIASDLVRGATRVVMGLQNGFQPEGFAYQDKLALEVVLTTRGRPALTVLDGQIESIHPGKHASCEMWRAPLEKHQSNLLAAASATGAIVAARPGRPETSVQGTAWLIQPDLVITNRHVLFPDLGMQLALRKREDPTAAALPQGLAVWIDFAFDAGARRETRHAVSDILYVSAQQDPVDVAILRIQPSAPHGSSSLRPLRLASSATVPDELYVVGHPGRIDGRIPESIRAVFGIPDARKRVSLGQCMGHNPRDVFHDASTIDGYSGGCLLGFTSQEVIGLHYYGDPITGNRALSAPALRSHAVARYFPN